MSILFVFEVKKDGSQNSSYIIRVQGDSIPNGIKSTLTLRDFYYIPIRTYTAIGIKVIALLYLNPVVFLVE
ncbi:hypothetical protein [Candidatus Nitrosocosmicus hydrocola]|uniref:hypothetical protein n=1 Tax=Candidatus Nitrosocosmicus hydrocola TaxID=1826872 RepID=UPI0011E59B0C|nr:hypothetical protein [Candidatus Nitrosocosmicus hydrocola]